MTETVLPQLKGAKKIIPVKAEEVRVETEQVVSQVEKPKEVTKARPTKDAIARRNRRTKSPINGRRNILTVKGLDPGMVGRWVDTTPERVDELLEQGYDVVREKVQVGDTSIDGGTKTGATITKRVGGGKESILMQIPKEWYDADQAEKQKIVDKREATIYGEGQKGSDFYGKVKAADVVPGRRPSRRDVSSDDSSLD